MMNAEIKTKWLEALRSGKYKQGIGLLRRTGASGDYFCCLGVLCDILDPDGWLYTDHDWYHNDSRYVPSQEICLLAHFKRLWPSVLASKNDKGYSFEEIADWIEENL